jgi:hypothetical protein
VRSSSAADDNNLLERTVELWRPRLGRDLSREDARQIVENVSGFFAILAEWSRAERPSPQNGEATEPVSSTGVCRDC